MAPSERRLRELWRRGLRLVTVQRSVSAAIGVSGQYVSLRTRR